MVGFAKMAVNFCVDCRWAFDISVMIADGMEGGRTSAGLDLSLRLLPTQIPGVDCAFIGPGDLATSMGLVSKYPRERGPQGQRAGGLTQTPAHRQFQRASER